MTEHAGSRPAVALLGTGIMGAGMGRSMLRAGLPLTVWNRTPARAQALTAEGASVAAAPADAHPSGAFTAPLPVKLRSDGFDRHLVTSRG